jgi:signal peptidase I
MEIRTASPESASAGHTLPKSASRPRRRGPSLVQQLFQCLCVGALAFGSYYVISNFFVTTVEVVGSSMVPTLRNSEHYLLNRWVYHFRQPQKTEVVVIRDPSANCFSVKRVIAVGGDSVFLKAGTVFVNGEKLKEPYLAPETPTFAYGQSRDQFFTCGKDQFFLLGDNRMNSADSRTYGPVPRGNILGLVVR